MTDSRSQRRQKRKKRGKLIFGTEIRPRLVISKTNLYLIAQAIDDNKGHTIIYLSTASLGEKTSNLRISKTNKSYAQKLGEIMAKSLKDQGFKSIVFDRNAYPYHGKIEAFCQALQQEGLISKNGRI